MINPNTFKNEAYKIREIFEELEFELLEKISNDLFRGAELDVSDWKIQKLANLTKYTGNSEQIIKEARKINKEMAEIIESSYIKGIKESDNIIPKDAPTTQASFFKLNEERVLSLVREAQMLNIEALQEFYGQVGVVYQDSINRAVSGVISGAETLYESIKNSTQQLAEQGVGYVTYGNNRKVNIASYMEMATRTVANKTAQQATTARNKEYGYDLVLISQYQGCSDTCMPHQGRIFFDDTLGDVNNTDYPNLSEAIANGLFHPNCKHHKMPYDPEVQEEQKVIENDTELYEKEQKQRYIERNTREWKRRDAVAQGDDKQYTQTKVREWQRKNRELVASDDRLRREYIREQIQ